MTERRDATRLPLQLEVEHILGDHLEARCQSENLSRDGMRLSCLPGEAWGRPRHAWLQFRLPDDDEVIRALGELRYEGDGGPVRGFSFKYIYPRARRRLEAFLESAASA